MNDLIPLNNTVHLVATYNQVLEDLDSAFEIIKRSRTTLLNTLGEYRTNIRFDRGYQEESYDREVIKRNFWKFIVDKTGLRSLLSTKKLQELDEQLEENRYAKSLPEITEENIFNFLQENIEKAGDLVEEAIREVFQWLTPQERWGYNYKTNNHEEIKEKVILDGIITGDYLNHYREDKLNAIDKLFHLLDGQGIPKHPHTLTAILGTAIREKKQTAETVYYRLKWFKKGTLHIEFKRPDLVKEINKRVGSHVLKKAA